MQKRYESGTFCKSIQCERHAPLEGLKGEAYLQKKAVHCKDCYAWKFLNWMKDNGWRIVLTVPEISSKELAARIKGIDIVRVEDLTEDEILTL
ncbi:MAG: hypothetical protein JW807_07230 [Spirochaetes bacterium]|nr:hypothetical protein [Spirochaetota bacterium]